jgi:hypothetical protein
LLLHGFPFPLQGGMLGLEIFKPPAQAVELFIVAAPLQLEGGGLVPVLVPLLDQGLELAFELL